MAKGISLHIGLNSVDARHYDGWDGALMACEADAQDMEAVAAKEAFTRRKVLLTSSATFDAVVKELKDAAQDTEADDLFMLTYSGHGGQIPDLNRDEDDLIDETWCLYDRQLVDDHLYQLLGAFKPGVRIIVLSDSCHSGTVTRATRRGIEITFPAHKKTRAMPPDIASRVYRKNRQLYIDAAIPESIEMMRDAVKSSVILFSGCQDNQLSSDGTFNGLFTGVLLSVWQSGRFKGSYRSLHRDVVRMMPPTQTPNYYTTGSSWSAFEDQRPFTVNV